MTEIIVLLDELAEFQAQADYLELKRAELIDAVKVPTEVIAAQDEANKRRRDIEAAYAIAQSNIRAVEKELLAEVVDPEMPAEFVAALEAAAAQREEIRRKAIARLDAEQKRANEAKAQIDAELTLSVKEVYTQVASRKAEINAEFSQKSNAVKDNLEALTARIKDEVKRAGATVKAKFYQAVYVKGRTSWNTDMLEGMIVAFPALEKARKVGEPSVTIRRVGS